MSYNLVDPVTGDLTRVAGNSNIVDSAIETTSTWSSKKINDSLVNIESALDELESITRLTDFDEAIPEKGKNKIYYVNKLIDTYSCAQWRVESMYYDVSELGQYRGVQRATSINGVDNIMLMREYYLDDNNVIRWTDWQEVITSNNIGSQTVAKANKIIPNYTSVALTTVTTATTKYIKLADCGWQQTGTLQVHLRGNNFVDTLVINFGGGSGSTPMLCGYYSGNSYKVFSVIAQKGSAWDSNYAIYIKLEQSTNLTVNIALLKGDCTINITESTTAPENISEWTVGYGLFGNITSPNITSLEQRVTALESKLQKASN